MKKNNPPKLIILAPCFNEQEVLPNSHQILYKYIKHLIQKGNISPESRVCYIDDGSKDNTWDIISEYMEKKECLGVKLSRNFGHQKAILSGMESYKNLFDLYITIDVDLQDDHTVIEEMIEKSYSNNIVYGVRNNRDTDSFFKRTTAVLFYKLMLKMGVDIVYNHADYRLIDNKILNEFVKYKEQNLFIRGIFPAIGYKNTSVYYKRKERLLGESKYPLKKMLNFAWDGITSFSVKPIKVIFFIGLLSLFISFIFAIWVVIMYMQNNTIQGWTSIVLLFTFFSSINLLSISIIGEYVGKIYTEVKQRPRYTIEYKSKINKK